MARMIALGAVQWALLGACYLALCVRMALRMAKTGRSFWMWLAITIPLTGIPAFIVLLRDHMRARSGPSEQESHSGAADR